MPRPYPKQPFIFIFKTLLSSILPAYSAALHRARKSQTPMPGSLSLSLSKKMESQRAWIRLRWLLLCLAVQLVVADAEFFKPFNVSYDHRALIIDGKRRMLISAGIHYPRATPEVPSEFRSLSVLVPNFLLVFRCLVGGNSQRENEFRWSKLF